MLLLLRTKTLQFTVGDVPSLSSYIRAQVLPTLWSLLAYSEPKFVTSPEEGLRVANLMNVT